MKIINPTSANMNNFVDVKRWAQSVYKAMSAGTTHAAVTGKNAAGLPNAFTQDNGDGVMLKIGGSASTEVIKWVTLNVPIVINHGLQRQPIGFTVMDKDKTCDVYRTAVQTVDTISLACTDATANVLVYIF